MYSLLGEMWDIVLRRACTVDVISPPLLSTGTRDAVIDLAPLFITMYYASTVANVYAFSSTLFLTVHWMSTRSLGGRESIALTAVARH